MTFGRHKGMAVAHLPVDYLGWVAERMPHPPGYLLAELRRQADIKDTRDAMIAQAELFSRLFPMRPKKAARPGSLGGTPGSTARQEKH